MVTSDTDRGEVMDQRETLETAAAANGSALRTWTRPEAKAAEVAKATLGSGGDNPAPQDGIDCAS